MSLYVGDCVVCRFGMSLYVGDRLVCRFGMSLYVGDSGMQVWYVTVCR